MRFGSLSYLCGGRRKVYIIPSRLYALSCHTVFYARFEYKSVTHVLDFEDIYGGASLYESLASRAIKISNLLNVESKTGHALTVINLCASTLSGYLRLRFVATHLQEVVSTRFLRLPSPFRLRRESSRTLAASLGELIQDSISCPIYFSICDVRGSILNRRT